MRLMVPVTKALDSRKFDEGAHPRAPKDSHGGKYKPGEFVPGAQISGEGTAAKNSKTSASTTFREGDCVVPSGEGRTAKRTKRPGTVISQLSPTTYEVRWNSARFSTEEMRASELTMVTFRKGDRVVSSGEGDTAHWTSKKSGTVIGKLSRGSYEVRWDGSRFSTSEMKTSEIAPATNSS